MSLYFLSFFWIFILGISSVFADPADEAKAAATQGESIVNAGASDRVGKNAIDGSPASNAAASTVGSAQGSLTIYTSEKIPGADCVCAIDNRDANDIRAGMTLESQCGIMTTKKYKCTVQTGLSGFQAVFAQIIRYAINIVLLLGVLAVVGLGIAWSFAGGDDVKMKSTLKTWAINIIVGLVILFMFRYILLFLAPWVYQ